MVRTWAAGFVSGALLCAIVALTARTASAAPADAVTPSAIPLAGEGDASGTTPAIDQITLGLGGLYKPGCWTPVRIRLRGPAKAAWDQLAVELELDDSDGVPVRYQLSGERPVSLDADGVATTTLYGRFGRLTGEVRVRLRAGERVLATRVERSSDLARCLPTQERLIVEWGKTWNAADAARAVEKDADSFSVARIEDPREMPDQWFGWESADTVLMSTSDSGGQPIGRLVSRALRGDWFVAAHFLAGKLRRRRSATGIGRPRSTGRIIADDDAGGRSRPRRSG
jgi:hypothetical protein